MADSIQQKETQNAIRNFPNTLHPALPELVNALIIIKKAAALANKKAGSLEGKIADAIVEVSDQLLNRRDDSKFQTHAIQGGAGTSINMNVDEVIATLASEKVGLNVLPLDHVNLSQSTNDVNPSALKLALLIIHQSLLTEIDQLVSVLNEKATKFQDVIKLGRTHLQDAVPFNQGQEFKAFADTISRDTQKLKASAEYLLELNLGGTAVGNSVNASKEYIKQVYIELNELTGLDFKPALNMIALTSSGSDFTSYQYSLLVLFSDLSKMATDLRVLSSGPAGGIGEIILPRVQAGSSIMPAKVNPVMPEYINQVFYYIAGKSQTALQAAEAASLQLGIMFPVLADSLLNSAKLAHDSIRAFRENCVSGIELNIERIERNLHGSFAYAALLTPVLGYEKVAEYVSKAIKQSKELRTIVLENEELTAEEFDKLLSIDNS